MDTKGPHNSSNHKDVVCEHLYTKLLHCNKLPDWSFINLNRIDRQTGMSQLPNGLTRISQCLVYLQSVLSFLQSCKACNGESLTSDPVMTPKLN